MRIRWLIISEESWGYKSINALVVQWIGRYLAEVVIVVRLHAGAPRRKKDSYEVLSNSLLNMACL